MAYYFSEAIEQIRKDIKKINYNAVGWADKQLETKVKAMFSKTETPINLYFYDDNEKDIIAISKHMHSIKKVCFWVSRKEAETLMNTTIQHDIEFSYPAFLRPIQGTVKSHLGNMTEVTMLKADIVVFHYGPILTREEIYSKYTEEHIKPNEWFHQLNVDLVAQQLSHLIKAKRVNCLQING